MRSNPLKFVEGFRVGIGEYPPLEPGSGCKGAFEFPVPGFSKVAKLFVIAASSDGWDHVSARVKTQTGDITPTWELMLYVKNIFFTPEEWCHQYMPAQKDNINLHSNVLHIWKPWDDSLIVRPPKDLV